MCRLQEGLLAKLPVQPLSGPSRYSWALLIGSVRPCLWLEVTCWSERCVCRCLSEIEAKYDKKMKMLRDELDLRRKTEIHEVEERKNGQINTLMQRHEEAFTDIKNYYNDITLNNLALINSLKVPTRSGPVGCRPRLCARQL